MKLLSKSKRQIVINVTSLIDVVLLLLIFFMITSRFSEQPGMKLELPESKTSSTEEADNLEIYISSENVIMLNGKEILFDNLKLKLGEIQNESKSIVIKADKNTKHGLVVQIMDIAKQSGIYKIVIATKSD